MTDATLPPELISHILSFLPPSDPLSVPTLLTSQRVSTSFASLARHSSLWFPHATHRWTRGTPPSTLLSTTDEQQQEHPEDVYSYYRRRALQDARANELVNLASESIVNRLPYLNELRQLGSDVLDILSHGEETTEVQNAELWLTLRWWSRQGRSAVLRDDCVRNWMRIRDGEIEDEAEAFELGVTGFVAFRGADPASMREKYDLKRHPELVEAVKNSFEGERALKHVAESVCAHMKRLGLKPATQGNFHHINNHFLNTVWASAATPQNHGTLPMSLVSIFCSFIRRLDFLDIQARPIGFPGVLLAGVANRGKDNWVYVNVFAGGKILEQLELQRMLSDMGLTMEPSYIAPASAKEMVFRVARNILTSVRNGDDGGQGSVTPSLYATATALFLLSPPEPTTLYANWIVSICQAEYPIDVNFIEDHVVATYSERNRVEEVLEICEAIKMEDRVAEVPKLRSEEIVWPIGHVFIHRLFGYAGVIRGWDETCEAGEQWIQAMSVDSLPRGRHQPFYHVITSEGNSRYVAQENITASPVSQSVYDALTKVSVVGRYFRRLGFSSTGRQRFVMSKECEAMYPEA